MRLPRNITLSLAAVVFSAVSPLASAAVITNTYTGSFPHTFSGTLPNQASVLEETFTLPSASLLTAVTTSYDGTSTGGFVPNLTLYDSMGNYLASQWGPGVSPLAPTNFNGYLQQSLMAGTYTLTLTDEQLSQSLTATNLSDGFTNNAGNGVDFIDPIGLSTLTATGNYSLNVTATPSAATATPEPATFWLTVPLIALLAFFGRKRVASAIR